MISIRLFSFFVVCFAFALVLSTPTPDAVKLYKRSDSTAILDILQTIQTDISSILPQLDSVVADGQVTDGNIRPLLTSLVDTAVTAVQALAALSLPINFVDGASLDALVALAVAIVSALAATAIRLLVVLPNLLDTVLFVVRAVLAGLTGL